MSEQTDALGGRLPLADPAALNPAQREIFNRMSTRIVPWANDTQFQSIAENGRLIGPVALRLTQQLSTSHRVDEPLYREAEAAFGTKGLIDIAFLIGIYHSVCATLTMFAIPAPE